MRCMPLLLAALTLVPACAADPGPGTTGTTPSVGQSLLARSSPPDGATVAGPVNALALHFARPARLGEVTVTGSDGTTMPMMVTAVGEVLDYSIPLSGLEAGSYTVRWKASALGTNYQGAFRFDVR